MPFQSDKQRRAAYARKSMPALRKPRLLQPQRIVLGLRLTGTPKGGLDFTTRRFDWHVRLEGGEWFLDQFDSNIKDANDAHCNSTQHDSLREAVLYAKEEDS